MASVLDLDIREIVLQKIEKNTLKYPVEKAWWNAVKYTELREIPRSYFQAFSLVTPYHFCGPY